MNESTVYVIEISGNPKGPLLSADEVKTQAEKMLFKSDRPDGKYHAKVRVARFTKEGDRDIFPTQVQ